MAGPAVHRKVGSGILRRSSAVLAGSDEIASYLIDRVPGFCAGVRLRADCLQVILKNTNKQHCFSSGLVFGSF